MPSLRLNPCLPRTLLSRRVTRVLPSLRHASTTSGGDTTNATNLRPPTNKTKSPDSANEQSINSSRGVKSDSPDTASLAHPGTPGAAQGQDEEGSHPAHQDKDLSAGQKKAKTESLGKKPLDEGQK